MAPAINSRSRPRASTVQGKPGSRPSPSPVQARSYSQQFVKPVVQTKVQTQNQDQNSNLSQNQSSMSTSKATGPDSTITSNENAKNHVPRQFKLISVKFKEAALDSPSFRASVNHIDSQIDNIDKWLRAIDSSVKKIPRYIKELQTFGNSFLEHLVPTFIQDGLIDQEYTVQALKSTSDSLTKLWGDSLAALSINTYVNENLNRKLFKVIQHYQNVRTEFEIAQQKYDQYLAIYVSTPKIKEASIVIEDAKQLFEVRKDYIHSCLKLVTEISALENQIDRSLVRYCSDIWKSKRTNLISIEAFDPIFSVHSSKIKKIQGWCDSYSSAIEKLKDDMLVARDQVEESAKLQFSPSMDVNDYKISLINSKVLDNITDLGFEKHGYLFMKTYVEKASKPIWVKRWVFIKGGVFGLLVLSPSQTFVQESDKIGILLCNVKYAPHEDRKFCFEIKTIDHTFVFQAETLLDLKSWLKIFQNEKERILKENDPQNNDLINLASGRYPPIVTEFASTLNTSTDREFTNTKVINTAGQIITSSKLSHQIEHDERFFKRHIYYQIPQVRPPFMTDQTKSSIIAYSLAAANTLPTALTANIWGSANWGLYYLHEVPPLEREHPYLNEALDSVDRETLNLDGDKEGINYPDYYPYELVPLDIQMRALFETAVSPGELCLFSYRCIWSPNSHQELSGRCFITNRHVYFYMQSLGFIALTKLPIEHLVAVDYSTKKNHDMLKIYNMNGVVKMKLFLDDGKLIKRKLTYLLENNASDHPKHFHEVINNLVKLENQHQLELKNEARNTVIATNLGIPVDLLNLRQHQLHLQQQRELQGEDYNEELLPTDFNSFTVSAKDSIKTPKKLEFSDVSKLVIEQVYNAPPKALFHSLLGDDTNLLESYIQLIRLESVIKAPWQRKDGKLIRQYNCGVIHDGRKSGTIQFTDTIEVLIENEYYIFTHAKSSFKLLYYGTPASVEFRYVLSKVHGNRTKVSIYSRCEFHGKLLISKLVKPLAYSISRKEARQVEKALHDVVRSVGNRGNILKAINIYGKLSFSESDIVAEKVKPITMRPTFFIKFILGNCCMFVLSHVSNIFHFVLNLFITLLKSIRLNQVLILIIGLLSVLNLFLSTKTTTAYWATRRANNVARDFLMKDPVMLKRAIYLKDTQDMINSHNNISNNGEESPCYKSFKDVSFIMNYDKFDNWNKEYGDESTKLVAQGLKKTFQEIGIKRHKLLVDLRMLNEMEEELGKAEWRNWIMNELGKCAYIKSNLFDQVQNLGEDTDDLNSGIDSVMQFCHSCEQDLKYLDSLL